MIAAHGGQATDNASLPLMILIAMPKLWITFVQLACCVVLVSCGCDSIKRQRAILSGVERIPIPEREHGYKYIEAQVIASDAQFDSLLKLVNHQEHWNRKSAFVSALRHGKPDFEKSSLVLFTDTRGSGSIKVGLDGPFTDGQDVTIRINYDSPRWLTMDMAYRCFAYSIPKGTGDRLLVIRRGRRGKNAEVIELRLPK